LKDHNTYGEYIALARKTNQSGAKCLGARFEESRAEQSTAQRRNRLDTMDFAIETNLDRILTVLEVLGNLKQVLVMKHRNHNVQSSKPAHEGWSQIGAT
jgi:hypothetical protein